MNQRTAVIHKPPHSSEMIVVDLHDEILISVLIVSVIVSGVTEQQR